MATTPSEALSHPTSVDEPSVGGTWARAVPLDRLDRDGKAVAKIGGKQIALFRTPDGILACNNRCPHEGYPLREGTLDGGCVLTCNWHNWKFDLRSGANLYGGDRLRIYPTLVKEGAVWVDVADPPAEERRAQALANLRAAFGEHEYDRMARELARFVKAGGDGAAAVAAAILWSHDRLEFGTTHAFAAASGWLRLHDESSDPETRLLCLAEAVGYMAWDTLREATHPYPAGMAAWNEAAFLAAIEAQDEAAAIGVLRGALDEGRHFTDLERALTKAALAHYADFGHSLIYLVHSKDLIARLGQSVEAPLLMALVRSFVYASREDLIPEFRAYAAALRRWPTASRRDPVAALSGDAFRNLAVDKSMTAVVEAASHAAPEALALALFEAAALNLRQFDTGWEARTDGSVAQNVGWLDFTHGLTFANAARRQCALFPELWPAALLQMACFVGRNTGFTTDSFAVADWRAPDRNTLFAHAFARIFDHGEDRYILAAHLLKTTLAVRDEVAAGLPPAVEAAALAALDRFLNAPLKRKHVRRTAHQAMVFVALED